MIHGNEFVKKLNGHQGCILQEAICFFQFYYPLEYLLPIFPLDALMALDYIFSNVYLDIVSQCLLGVLLAGLAPKVALAEVRLVHSEDHGQLSVLLLLRFKLIHRLRMHRLVF